MLKVLIGSVCSFFLLPACVSKTEKMQPKVYTVEIKQMRFEPAELTLQKGDTVVWVNLDIVPHDVTEESRKVWSSSLMPTGKSWSLVVTQSADYYCSIHVVMKGKLVIE
jgi:plastocyanin